jgi:hypothetical protein
VWSSKEQGVSTTYLYRGLGPQFVVGFINGRSIVSISESYIVTEIPYLSIRQIFKKHPVQRLDQVQPF